VGEEAARDGAGMVRAEAGLGAKPDAVIDSLAPLLGNPHKYKVVRVFGGDSESARGGT